MALLPQRQSGLLPKPRTQLLPLDMGASVRAEAEGHQQRFGAPQGAYIPFPTMPTKEQIGQWALQNPLDAAALATSPIPVVGDVVGFAADANALYNDPSWSNAGWMAAGLLPFVPAGTIKRIAGTAGDMPDLLHGTPKQFDKFDISKVGTSTDQGMLGTAIYFSPDEKVASAYAEGIKGKPGSGRIIKTAFPDGNFKIFEDKSGMIDELVKFVNEDGGNARFMGEGWADAVNDAAKRNGLDGIVLMGTDGVPTEVAIYNPDILGNLEDIRGNTIPTDEASRMARAEQGSLPLGDTPDPEGARMRRAQKMGYNTDLELYRGTTAKGEKEVPQSFEAGAGVFTSTNPDVAEVFRYPREYGESVTEVFDDAVGDFVPVEPGDLQKVHARMQNPLVLRGDEAQAFTNDTAMQSRMIKDAIKRGKDSIILEDVVEGVGDSVHRGTTVVALKPIRSTNAKFDMSKADSADLMAGIAGGLLGLGAYNRLSAEEEY